jgi:hypothetical protein
VNTHFGSLTNPFFIFSLQLFPNYTIMKKLLVFAAALVAFTSTNAQDRSLKDIIGKWQMPGNFGSLEFIDSTHLVTTMQGRKVGEGTYVMDFTKNPIWLDVTIRQGGRSMTTKQILEFIDDNTIRWQNSATLDRPKAFEKTPYGAPIVLTREK